MKPFLNFIVFLSLLNSCLGIREEFIEHLWKPVQEIPRQGLPGRRARILSLRAYSRRNVELIDKHNQDYSMGIYTYRLGINPYTDWTVEEFRAHFLGTRPSLSGKYASVGVFTRSKNVKVPDSVDLAREGSRDGR